MSCGRLEKMVKHKLIKMGYRIIKDRYRAVLMIVLLIVTCGSFILMGQTSLTNDQIDVEELVQEKEKARLIVEQKKYHSWRGEVISKELVKVWEGEIHIVEVYKVRVRIAKPKLEELIENEKEYFDWLIKTLGKAGEEIVQRRIEGWKKWLESIKGDYFEIESFSVKVKLKGTGTIDFWNALYFLDEYGNLYPMDPVNLVFYGPAGSAWDVQYDMKNWLTYKWVDTTGITLYTMVDKDHADGKDWVFKPQDYQLRYGDPFGYSYHIRIYDGGYDWDLFLEWCIANVHYEKWV